MSKKNSIGYPANNSNGMVPQSVSTKQSVIAFLAQIPCYEWNGEKVFILKESCEKMGYQHTTHFKELITDNSDGIIELETREQIEEFERKNQMNELSFGPSVSHATLLTPNALIEGLQNSNHPIAKQIRKDGTDVYVRYLQGESVNLMNDLGADNSLSVDSRMKLLAEVSRVYGADTIYYKNTLALTTNTIYPQANLPLQVISTGSYVLTANDVVKKIEQQKFFELNVDGKRMKLCGSNIGKLRKTDNKIAELSQEVTLPSSHTDSKGIQQPNTSVRYDKRVVQYIIDTYTTNLFNIQ